MAQGLLERSCPACGTVGGETLLVLREEQFTRSNSSYRLERIPELGLDPRQEYPFLGCRGCGLSYSFYRLSAEKEAFVYNHVIDSSKSRQKVLSVGRQMGDLQRCLSLLELESRLEGAGSELSLVDYGCGWGTLLRVARGAGIRALGYDATSWKTDWARAQGIEIVTTERELLDRAPFDLLVSTSVLEHLAEPSHAARLVRALLKPGGFALVSCIVSGADSRADWRQLARCARRGEPLPKEINPWEHLNYFTHRTLADFLWQNARLRPVRVPGLWMGPRTPLARAGAWLLKRALPTAALRDWGSGYWSAASDRD